MRNTFSDCSWRRVASVTTESRTRTVFQHRLGKPWPEQGDKDLQRCDWPHPFSFCEIWEPYSFTCLGCLLWREKRQRQSDWGEYEVETGPDHSQTCGVNFLNHKCIWCTLPNYNYAAVTFFFQSACLSECPSLYRANRSFWNNFHHHMELLPFEADYEVQGVLVYVFPISQLEFCPRYCFLALRCILMGWVGTFICFLKWQRTCKCKIDLIVRRKGNIQ